MGLPTVVIEGNLGADPEMRFTPSGAAVANFRVGTSERRKNQQTQEWEDGDTCWLSVVCWRDLAENVADTLHKGDKVIVTGRLYEETYTPQGTDQPRTVMKVKADTVAPSLRSATAQVRRTERQQGGQQQGGQPPQQGQQQGWGQQPPAQDPWATQPQQGQQPQQRGGWGQQPPQQPQAPQQGGWGQPPAYDEPPF